MLLGTTRAQARLYDCDTRRHFFVIALTLAVVAPAAPQQPYVESIEVRVANVDVIVRDKSGNPVTGLTKDDFELLENGVRQPITNFYEIRRQTSAPEIADTTTAQPETVPADIRQRRFVLFVDSSTLQPSSTKRLIESMNRFVAKSLQPEDQMMMVSWRFGMQVLTRFSSDRAVLERAIDALAHLAPAPDIPGEVKRAVRDYYDAALRGDMAWRGAYGEAIHAVETGSNQLVTRENVLFAALRRMESTVAGLEGKKVLLFVGNTLPIRPGAELYQYAYNLFWPHLDRTTNMPMEVMTGVTGQDAPARIEDIAKAASADGVTIYAISADDPNAEFGASAIRAKPMTYSTELRVKRGESTLSVAVLDQISGASGFARAHIAAH